MEAAPKCAGSQTTTRIKLRKCDETSGENPEKSVVSFFRVRSPTAQRRGINSESFRESLLTERY